MSATELLVLSAPQIALRREAIISDQEAPEKTAVDLMTIDQKSARALVQALPIMRQHDVIMAACASSELPFMDGSSLTLNARGRTVVDCSSIVPIIELLDPEEAAQIIALDVSLFSPISDEGLVHMMQRAGIDLEDDRACKNFKRDHAFQVRGPTGELEQRLIDFDPNRAFAYLNTIIQSDEEEWVEATLSHAGADEMLALLMIMFAEGEFQIDEDEWEDFAERYPDHYWNHSRTLTRREDRSELLAQVTSLHCEGMEHAFRIAEDQVAAIMNEAKSASSMADDLLADI